MVAPRSMSLSDWDSNFVSEVGSDSLDQVTINTHIILFGLTLVAVVTTVVVEWWLLGLCPYLTGTLTLCLRWALTR